MLLNLKTRKKYLTRIAIALTVGLLIFACASTSTDSSESQVDAVVNTDQETDAPQEIFDIELLPELQGEPDTTRSDPAPPGSEGEVEEMTISVIDINRPANDIVMGDSEFSLPPAAGKEYVLVTLEITCEASVDERCFLDIFNLKLFGDKGIVSTCDWGVSDLEGLLEDTEFFGGAVTSGMVLFTIDQDETGLILLYDSFSDHPLFLAIDGE